MKHLTPEAYELMKGANRLPNPDPYQDHPDSKLSVSDSTSLDHWLDAHQGVQHKKYGHFHGIQHRKHAEYEHRTRRRNKPVNVRDAMNRHAAMEHLHGAAHHGEPGGTAKAYEEAREAFGHRVSWHDG